MFFRDREEGVFLKKQVLGGVIVVLMLVMGVCFAKDDIQNQVNGHAAVNRSYCDEVVQKKLDELVVKEILSQDERVRVEAFLRDKWCLFSMWSRDVLIAKMASDSEIRENQAEMVVIRICDN